MWVERREYIPPSESTVRQVIADLSDAAFDEILRQTRGEEEIFEPNHASEFAPLATLLLEESIPRAEARRTFRLYVRSYTEHLYRGLHARDLEPMEFWRELIRIGRTWVRLQLAALAHAAGAGVRIRQVHTARRAAQPSE